MLHGVYLDAGGKMMATDGRRLFFRTAAGLRQLEVPVLLGPWDGGELPAAESATLEMGMEEAVLRIPGRPERRIPVMEGPYVKYEQGMRCSARQSITPI